LIVGLLAGEDFLWSVLLRLFCCVCSVFVCCVSCGLCVVGCVATEVWGCLVFVGVVVVFEWVWLVCLVWRGFVRFVVLSCASGSYSTQRLRAAAVYRGHGVRVLNTLRFAIDLSGPEPDLLFRGRPLSDYDAIVPRIGSSITYFGTAVVRQFEQMDVYTPNTANGIANSRDKLRASQILSRHNIAMPATAFVRSRADVRSAIERVGGAPVVIKLLEGTQGIGVILAPEVRVAEAIIETLHSTRHNVLIQSFVSESRGRDVRALVVGDRVVAAMRRRAKGDEFRSNVHRGGSVEACELPPEYALAAVRCLSVSTGYGVAELVVLGNADLIGKNLDESGLAERDITVLTLHRGTNVIPNPRKNTTLETGDRLLCFGKLEEMRSMIPQRRHRRPKVQKLPPKPLPETRAASGDGQLRHQDHG